MRRYRAVAMTDEVDGKLSAVSHIICLLHAYLHSYFLT